MKKKAVIFSLFTDMLGWIIFFFGIIAWMIVFTITQAEITVDLSGQGGYIGDDGAIINMLETPVSDSTNLADEILLAIHNQPSEAKPALDHILNGIYGQAENVCWRLWQVKGHDEDIIFAVDCEEKLKKEIINQQATIPSTINSEPVTIRLVVLGYKE